MLAPPKTELAAGSLRELLRVALPLVISAGSVSLTYVADRIFLTWYSNEALAAALPAGLWHWTLISLFIGAAGYVNTFVAQYEGAGSPDRVTASIWQGIYFALLSALPLLACAPLSPWLFDALGHESAVADLEAEYFAILCVAAGPMILSTALSCFYSGRGQTSVIMWINVVSAVVNCVLDYLLIFGIGGLPELGIAGAAWGTVIGSLVTCALYIFAMMTGEAGRRYRLWPPKPLDLELCRRLLRYGLPNGFHLLLDVACFTLFIQLVGFVGAEELAATNLAFNLNGLAFVPMLGFGTAVMTITGQRIGEGRPQLAVRTTWLAFKLAGMYMGVFAAAFVLAPGLLLEVYARGAEAERFAAVARHVAPLLRFVAVYCIFDAMAIVFGSAIRGAGDTRFSLVFSTLSGLFLMVLPTYAATQLWPRSLLAPWFAVTAHVVVLGTGLLLRFQQGRWQSMRVIEPLPAPLVEPTGL